MDLIAVVLGLSILGLVTILLGVIVVAAIKELW